MRLNLSRPPAEPRVTLFGVLGAVLDLLHGIRDEQTRQGLELAAIREALERGRGARDAADVALLMVMAEAIGDRPFTSRHLFAHARTVAPALLEALEACDVTNARELGWLCRRFEGPSSRGVWLERDADGRDGIVWRVRVSESQTREP